MTVTSFSALIAKHPLLKQVSQQQEVFWSNPDYASFAKAAADFSLSQADIDDAEARLLRFAPYIAEVFPETQANNGLIESPLRAIPAMQHWLSKTQQISGKLLLKCDSHLAISGSIKARGGIYEVLKHAETLALKAGLLKADDDYSILQRPDIKDFFAQHHITVGSTGNLGLSIGIMAAALGFLVSVHMSSDAKAWKKQLLRSKGVHVVEHRSDYSQAVAAGRAQADADPYTHFIDDEHSTDLFLGYAVAAKRLQQQLEAMDIQVDAEHPLFVYLPCGVGGGPGGITFGLKHLFGDAVHCFFAEPTPSPCMLLGLMTGLHERISVADIGLDNRTDADGLAVGRASGFIGKLLARQISGCYTITDTHLHQLLRALYHHEALFLEPSALAGMAGPAQLLHSDAGKQYIHAQQLTEHLPQATHIVWGTGGSMVPEEIQKQYIAAP